MPHRPEGVYEFDDYPMPEPEPGKEVNQEELAKLDEKIRERARKMLNDEET